MKRTVISIFVFLLFIQIVLAGYGDGSYNDGEFGEEPEAAPTDTNTNSGGGSSSSSSSSSSGGVCSPKWDCSDWGNCMLGDKAERNCTNTNNCYLNKPNEERYCYYPRDTQTTNTPINQSTVQPIEELQEPETTEQTIQPEKEGMAVGWKIAITVFIVIAIMAIGFAIYKKGDEPVEQEE